MSEEYFENQSRDWVSIEEFSSFFDVPKRTLTRYVSDGKIKSAKLSGKDSYLFHFKNAYKELKEIHPSRFGVAQKKSTPRDSDRSESLDAAKVETTRLKAELLKLELEAKLGKIVPRDVIESIETEYMSRLKAMILQTPSQIARATGVDEEIIKKIIENTLNQFSDALDVKKKRYEDYLQTIS